ncbi:hypothetical protein N4T20_19320 [Flavobacterium sp. TR2]|uniref:hypothetical protein n=1 Tax=Flavobacterium sp. TR2 TaxID=2977321 RepID=UPI0021B1136D|nr:hypothetical protein [Flavobacterium sp. TR2]UWY27861.1 hypothetical protein N4T20_19320 [Flavobacterium sp. TR2]
MKKIAKLIFVLFCFSINAQVSNQNNKGLQSKNKISNNNVSYVYYTFLEMGNSVSKKDFFGDIIPPEYSKMYSISNYTNELEKSLQFCLIKNYKEMNGKIVVLIPHLFFDRHSLLQSWQKEKGNVFNSYKCSNLSEFGINEQ